MSEAQSSGFALTEAAMRRLDASITRLQAAVEREGVGNSQMAQELCSARADLAALQTVTGEVSGRLDAAILRLKSLLET